MKVERDQLPKPELTQKLARHATVCTCDCFICDELRTRYLSTTGELDA
jgi:hypothetical protein